MTVDLTTVGGLKLPKRMLALIESGAWPRESMDSMRMNTEPLVSVERIHRFAPEEHLLVLYPPPFFTIAEDLIGDTTKYWSRFGALNEIIPELIVPFGDFGMGSDTSLALDYRADRENPAVIRLLWREYEQPNTWVRCTDSFDEFADILGLATAS
jgi:hypothetical protein